MDADEIKRAVLRGGRVFWKNQSYEVVVDHLGQWFIKCHINDHHIGLTWQDGVTLNGKPEDFILW